MRTGMQSCNDFVLLNVIQLFEKDFDVRVRIKAEIDTLPTKGTHKKNMSALHYSRCVYFPSSVTEERNFR